MSNSQLLQTPLHALHLAWGARMTGFAGYDMPVNYRAGVLQEHLHCRAKAGMFDVSHMGQAILSGKDAAARLETLVAGDLKNLKPGRIRYTQLLEHNGGICDDLMVTRLPGANETEERLYLVVNAAEKRNDFTRIEKGLADLRLEILDDRALIALQGPASAAIIAKLFPPSATMPFMSYAQTPDGLFLSRCGYTGEDGFEISVPAAQAAALAQKLAYDPDVMPIGLGARDSLRLEAGLCLYGHDINRDTTPVEAALSWSISNRRRQEGGFPGDAKLQTQWRDGPERLRVGILPQGRAPAREGTEIQDMNGDKIGIITSGGFSPSLNRPIAMGYVSTHHSAEGTPLNLMVRGTALPAKIVALPFVPARFYRVSTQA